MGMPTRRIDQTLDLGRLQERAKNIASWLREDGGACFEEQRHLDEGSQERIYWHYGYMVALSDALSYLTGERPAIEAPCTKKRGTHN